MGTWTLGAGIRASVGLVGSGIYRFELLRDVRIWAVLGLRV